MKTRVTVRMSTGDAYEVTLETTVADALAEAIARRWMGTARGIAQKINELHLADGTSVIMNPLHIVAVERH